MCFYFVAEVRSDWMLLCDWWLQASNEITSLEGVDQLTSLTVLHLRENQVSSLSGLSNQLKSLLYINLRFASLFFLLKRLPIWGLHRYSLHWSVSLIATISNIDSFKELMLFSFFSSNFIRYASSRVPNKYVFFPKIAMHSLLSFIISHVWHVRITVYIFTQLVTYKAVFLTTIYSGSLDTLGPETFHFINLSSWNFNPWYISYHVGD